MFIRNMIGKYVNVDKNTISRERGKHARLYIPIVLTKLLLAMFSIKVSTIKWSMKDSTCYILVVVDLSITRKVAQVKKDDESGNRGENTSGTSMNGDHRSKNQETRKWSWTIVQKTKRTRKGKQEADRKI